MPPDRGLKLLQLNPSTGEAELSSPSGADHQKWTYRPTCDGSRGSVVLTNLGTGTSVTWTYNPGNMALANEAGLFAQSTPRRGLQWRTDLRYLAGTNRPWKVFQWRVERA